MVDLEIVVEEFRRKIEQDATLQDFIKDVLVIAGTANSNRAFYTIVYHLMGGKTFPKKLSHKISLCMDKGVIEKTFLKRNNYEQRVYGFLSGKKKDTEEYEDLYYSDKIINLGHGSKASENGRGLSPKRIQFIENDICVMSVLQAIATIEKQVRLFTKDSKQIGKIEDMVLARKRILALSQHHSADDFIEYEEQLEDEQIIKENEELSEAEKETLILARRGQGKFRANVLNRNKCCPFTKISNPHLLIASHIKPWKDSNNKEKVDGNNGFAFTPTFDRLFDQGYISFNNDKTLLISETLSKECRDALHIRNGQVIEGLIISDKCKEYLEFHRSKRFRK
ncbi:MAG: HNH endonuclease [Lachnospiraceae bacterium]|nr:HNH endonuclease [Lachnospiraceae bacterium]